MAQVGRPKIARNRTGSINLRIDGKVKYLAEIAARYKHLSFAEFIEEALKSNLSPQSVEREPKVAEPIQAMQQADASLWREGLWHEDEATRMFLLAVSEARLLTLPQMRLWTLLTTAMLANKGQITLATFREYYNDPRIDTKHLAVDEGAN